MLRVNVSSKRMVGSDTRPPGFGIGLETYAFTSGDGKETGVEACCGSADFAWCIKRTLDDTIKHSISVSILCSQHITYNPAACIKLALAL